MLLNSDLTNKEITIPESTIDRLEPSQNKTQREHTRQRLIWAAKTEDEVNEIHNLFSRDVADFIIGTPSVKFSFDHLKPQSRNHVEIVTAKMNYNLQDNNYIQSILHTGKRIIKGSNTFKNYMPKANAIEKLEFTIPSDMQNQKKLSTKRIPTPEIDRVLISIDPALNNESPSIKAIEQFIENTYPSEIDRFKAMTVLNGISYAASSLTAKISDSIKPTSYTKTYRFNGY